MVGGFYALVADVAEIVGVAINGSGPKIFTRISSSVPHLFLIRLATMIHVYTCPHNSIRSIAI